MRKLMMRASGLLILVAALSISDPGRGPPFAQQARPSDGAAKQEREAIHLSGA
jgi:hypothetical protein